MDPDTTFARKKTIRNAFNSFFYEIIENFRRARPTVLGVFQGSTKMNGTLQMAKNRILIFLCQQL